MATKVIKIEIPIETKDNTGQVVDSISEKMEGLDSAAKKAQKSMENTVNSANKAARGFENASKSVSGFEKSVGSGFDNASKKASGFEKSVNQTQKSLLAMLKEKHYDLIILDIMMPGMNGYQTCLEIRKLTNAPILFLSARTKDSDKTLGFSSGGDDYLAKPFSYPELISRVKALIRRYQIYKGKDEETITEVPSHIHYHNLDIDRNTETVYRDGEAVDLTSTEYAMLLTLVTHPGQIFSAERLFEVVWNEPYYYGASNSVMVHIRNLRRKIEVDPAAPTLITTVWGKGYRCE